MGVFLLSTSTYALSVSQNAHASGVLFISTMRKGDAMENDSTGRQKIAITRLAQALHISEPIEQAPMSKGEAGRLISRMVGELHNRRLNQVIKN